MQILHSNIGQFYNQPKLCPNATWNNSATIFAEAFSGSTLPLVINRKNTIIAASLDHKQILICFNGSSNFPRTINITNRNPISLFPISDDQILVSYINIEYPYIDRWTLNGTLLSSTPIYGLCYFIFMDINNDLYCSASELHMVIRKRWGDQSNSITIVAGTGSPGSSTMMLNRPRGIFVTSKLDLYVADNYNSRVQLFQSGEINGRTEASSESNITVTSNNPVGITMDADGNLFIQCFWNDRVITVGPGGDRCLIGSNCLYGGSSMSVSAPWPLAFDSDGNLFVGNNGYNKILKYQLLGTNQWGKHATL